MKTNYDNFTLEELQEKRYVKVADKFDDLYEQHREFEDGFKDGLRDGLTKQEFIDEVNLGYGVSESLQCSRIVTHESGFYYDNEFCR